MSRPVPPPVESRAAVLAPPGLAVTLALAAWAEGVAPERLVQPTRGGADAVEARHLAIYLAHVTLGLDLNRLSRAFRRDRASLRHALRRVEDLRDDPIFDRRLSGLETVLAPLREEVRP